MTNGQAAGQTRFRGQTGSLALGAAGVRGADSDLGRPAHGGVRAASPVCTHRTPRDLLSPPESRHPRVSPDLVQGPLRAPCPDATHSASASPAGANGTPGSRGPFPEPRVSCSDSRPAPEESLAPERAPMLPASWVQPAGTATSFFGVRNCFRNQE